MQALGFSIWRDTAAGTYVALAVVACGALLLGPAVLGI